MKFTNQWRIETNQVLIKKKKSDSLVFQNLESLFLIYVIEREHQ